MAVLAACCYTGLAQACASAAPRPELDCSAFTHHEPDSPAAQALAEAFILSFHQKWPTEYMAFEQLWSVDQLGEFILFQGLVTVEESDLIVARATDGGMETIGRLTFNVLNRPLDEIIAALLAQSPDIPPTLLHCSDLSRFAPPLSP